MKAIAPAAFDALVREARAVGANPYDWALVLYEESGWDPARRNASGAKFYGLNQMGIAELAAQGLTVDQWLAMPAEAQIPHVARFWQAKRKAYGPLIYASAHHLLAYNYLPARVKHHLSPDEIDYPLTSAGDVDGHDANGKPYSFYSRNIAYDPPPRHGYTSIRDLKNFLANIVRQNPRDMATLRAGLDAAHARAGINPADPPVDPLGGGVAGNAGAGGVVTLPEVVISSDPEASRGGSGRMGPAIVLGLVVLGGALLFGGRGRA